MRRPIQDEAPTEDSAERDPPDAAPFSAAAAWVPWLGLPWTAWNEGLRLWQAWCQAWQPNGSGVVGPPAEVAELGERRMAPIAPWLPQVDATVIPLRRNGDAPGARAARLSLRVRMPSLPWSGPGEVIALEAIVARADPAARAALAGDAAKVLPDEAPQSD